MKHLPLFILSLLSLTITDLCFSQSTVNTAGGQITGSTGNISYSVGQICNIVYSGGGTIILEGVQQPYNSASLPVSLLQFNAKVTTNKLAELTWTTLSEYDNASFTVERSNDGINFKTVTVQPSLGSSKTPQQYSFIDDAPLIGTAYYRLKQTDTFGNITFSTINKVTIETAETNINAYPIPTNSILNLKINNATNESYTYTIFSTNGLSLLQEKITTNLTIVNTSSLTKGAYLLTVSRKNTVIKSFKFIKN